MAFEISVLGPLKIQTVERGTIPLKAKGLLAYLAMQDSEPVDRGKLSDLLWPCQSSMHARHSLRNCLLEIRRICGPVIEPGNATCQLVAETDVEQFISIAKSEKRSDLFAAMYLYRGDFLENLVINSEPWTEWMTSQSERLRSITIDVALRLSKISLAARDYSTAIDAAEKAVELDDLDDQNARSLMLAYAGAKQLGAAVRHYQKFEKHLREELGIRPEDHTRAIRDACCKRDVPRPGKKNTSDELRRIASKFSLALERKAKLTPELVRESVSVMLDAACMVEPALAMAAA